MFHIRSFRSGFKLDTLSENKSLQQKFAKQQPNISDLSRISAADITLWQFDINGPAPGFRLTSEAIYHGIVHNGDQLKYSKIQQSTGNNFCPFALTVSCNWDMLYFTQLHKNI